MTKFNLSDKIISYYDFDYATDDDEFIERCNVEKSIKEIFRFTDFLEKNNHPYKYEHLKSRLKFIFGKELMSAIEEKENEFNKKHLSEVQEEDGKKTTNSNN